MKTVAVVLFSVAVAISVVGCSSDGSNDPVTVSPTPSTTAATPVPATTTVAPSTAPVVTAAPPVSDLRRTSCQDMMPMLAALREVSEAAAQQSAEGTIAGLPATPEWAGLSTADRDATIAGIRDAANGQCQ